MLQQADLCAGGRPAARSCRASPRTYPPVVTGPDAPSLDAGRRSVAWHEVPGALPGARHAAAPPHRRACPAPDGRRTVLRRRPLPRQLRRRRGRDRRARVHRRPGPSTPRPPGVSRPSATPRVLPWFECPEAAASAGRLAGRTLDALRAGVRAEFLGASTCTHLNDACGPRGRSCLGAPPVKHDPAATAGPSVSTPVRVPGSARRTTSIEMDTRDGLVLAGRARDLVTPTRGDAVVVDEASFRARVGDYLGGQIIEAFTASPTIDGLEGLVGRSASRGFRRELQRLADEQGWSGARSSSSSTTSPAPRSCRGTRRSSNGATPAWRRHHVRSPPRALPRTCWPSPACAAGWQEGGAIVANVLDGRARSDRGGSGGAGRSTGPTTPSRGTTSPTRSRRTACAGGGASTSFLPRRRTRACWRSTPCSATATSPPAASRPSCTSTRSPPTSTPSPASSSRRGDRPRPAVRECPDAAGSATRLVGEGLDELRGEDPGRDRGRHDVHAPQRHAPGLRRRRRARRPRRSCAS